MARFFIDKNDLSEATATLRGDNHRHLSNVLRAKAGDRVVLCDGEGNEYLCRIERIEKEHSRTVIEDVTRSAAEPTVRVTVYQCLPKGDKLEYIIEKCVELGAHRFVPVLSSRCIARPDVGTMEKKQARWQAISESAAKQSGRGIVPEVGRAMTYRDAVFEMTRFEAAALFYEHADGVGIEGAFFSVREAAVMIGPEGGFSEEEILFAQQNKIRLLSLGKRILRCETAPVSALSVIMHVTGNM